MVRLRANKVEFGDFQTPLALAERVCALVARSGVRPATVVEPTCGVGAFLAAAAGAFPNAMLYGCERNERHVDAARRLLADHKRVCIDAADFFSHDWNAALARCADPVLIIGNPPWVTNATLGSLGAGNVPRKANADKLPGIHAITGSANFDISEWMIRQNIRWLGSRAGAVAVLCKTSVARKVLRHAWSARVPLAEARLYQIDAAREFGVAVDACLLYVRLGASGRPRCEVHASLESGKPQSTIGYRDGVLLADVHGYERWCDLRSSGFVGWRSGLKHDCSRVFELQKCGVGWRNGLGDSVSVEADVVFPLMKSSDVAHARAPRKHVLIPQRSMDESPLVLRQTAPRAWRYLTRHQDAIAGRASTIYRGRPPFSIFGVGPYSFAPWKVAIAGLYKELSFVKVAPIDDRPVLLDDTCYFLPCDTEAECDQLIALLSSPPATEFYSALAFWDAKRPITARLLNQLDLTAVAKYTGKPCPALDHLYRTTADAGESRQANQL